MSNSAILSKIQRFSIYDGPGTRTTAFFKGCNLGCRWCHNPETINFGFEFYINKDKCTNCKKCVEICPNHALNTPYDLNNEKCNGCKKCEMVCLGSARTLIGKRYEAKELALELLKDKRLFEETDGGITFSGGEPLLQFDFLKELIEEILKTNTSIAIDTALNVPNYKVTELDGMVDYFLVDIKNTDPRAHIEGTGVDNAQILRNIELINKSEIILRVPLINGFNVDAISLEGLVRFVKDLNYKSLHVLPYHGISKEKYTRLGLVYNDTSFVLQDKDIDYVLGYLRSNLKEVYLNG